MNLGIDLVGVAQVGAVVLAVALGGVFVLGLAWDLVRTRDTTEATRRSSRRAGGALVGAGSVAGTVAVSGVEVVSQAPEVALTLLGIGALVQGWHWGLFAVVALGVYVVSEAVVVGATDSS